MQPSRSVIDPFRNILAFLTRLPLLPGSPSRHHAGWGPRARI